MTNQVQIELYPLGCTLSVETGTPLQDVLFPYGVEFPCGGQGMCRGCRIKLLKGNLPVTSEQQHTLTPEERAAGWRLACQCNADTDLVIALEQWDVSILADQTQFEFTPRDGYGIAIDVGTTTIAAQLLDLRSGSILAVAGTLNPQAQYGQDIMSRVNYAVEHKTEEKLTLLVRNEIKNIISQLIQSASIPESQLKQIILVGNTVMYHLFCGIDPAPLSHYPFEPEETDIQHLSSHTLDWDLPGNPEICFISCLGGFVGSDLLAGIFALKMHESDSLTVLMDLGTNGEIVIGSRERIVCASTAAGPAFEGARISMGMRAATGAIAGVQIKNKEMEYHVLGNVTPKGICGSGLVDTVAAGLTLGKIKSNGRFCNKEKELLLVTPVTLIQRDIRELQLAKGAIAAGVRILLNYMQIHESELDRLHLAGAFGNYINPKSAQRIGLIKFPTEKIVPFGNTALLGAKLLLFQKDGPEAICQTIKQRTEHISLNEYPQFEDIYIDEMTFPEED